MGFVALVALVHSVLVLGTVGSLRLEPCGLQGIEGQAGRYHPDASHPWNRLHAAIRRRELAGGRAIGFEETDPLLWANSVYLVEPGRHAELMEALQSFVAAGEDRWIEGALPRGLMQHDLWRVFDWAVVQEVDFDLIQLARWEIERRRSSGAEADLEQVAAELGRERTQRRERRRSLARALVPALARVAPTAAALAELPDNLAALEKSWKGPREPDPKQPQQPFLPLGLDQSEGAWVPLGELHGDPSPLALSHAAAFDGRSAFEVSLRLPGGRAATLEWLETLRRHPTPTVNCDGTTCGLPLEVEDRPHRHLNPDVPELPPGSMVALVRRVIAIDDQNQLHLTPLVKSVQVRAFLSAPDGATYFRLGEQPQGWPWQAVAEFELDPARLLQGEDGGLVPIQPGQHAFSLFASHGDQIADLPADFDQRSEHSHLDSCINCHGTVGTLSLNSYTRIFTGPGTHLVVAVRELPRQLDVIGADVSTYRALEFKRERFDWGALWAWIEAERGSRPPGSPR